MMVRLGLPLLVAAVLALSACGDDDNGGSTVATQTVTQTVTQSTTPATTSGVPTGNRCPDIALTPNSGEGVFDITTENVSCQEAERLLRSDTGLRSWNCRVIATAPGRKTTSCSMGSMVIVFATEA